MFLGWDSMSANSNSSSVSFQSLFGKMKSNGRTTVPVQQKAEKPKIATEYSMGVRQLNKDGYEKYNVEGAAVYIAKAPESAFFNDGEAVIVKAEDGKMVGLCRPRSEFKIETVVEAPKVSVDQLFAGIQRGSDHNVEAFMGTYNNGILKKKPVTATEQK